MDDPAATLKNLDGTLDALEAACAPLFACSLAEMREAVSGVERVKLDVLLGFAINNLVWVYLRTRGIDPEGHDVSTELERIKRYYGKVRDTEAGSVQRKGIDKAAARRFILANISKPKPAPADELPSTSAAALAKAQAERVGMSNRFRFVPGEGERMDVDGEAEEESEVVEDDEDDGDNEDEEEEQVEEQYGEEDFDAEDDEDDQENEDEADEAAADALLAEVDMELGNDVSVDEPPKKRRRGGRP